ncbi:MAG TPA: alpha/beta hydrolase [Thermoanaerobaculia bacterium]|nr:alpha/beta hydrolase [Thermoanaerobaculia bacterium]
MRRRTGLGFLAGGTLVYVAGSYIAARSLSRRLISADGLAPNTTSREALLAALRASGAFVADYRHAGSPRVPALLAAIFASPGEPVGRATILFLHGKGGSASEWKPDALRALALGYNVLLPDLRGHRPSEGTFVTYGLLEKQDLNLALEAVRERFGADLTRLGVHACSAGCLTALEFSANKESVRALWLESPYADPAEMARHYLSVGTGLPRALLALASRWAIRGAVDRVRRELHLGDPRAGLTRIDPVAALARVSARICVVHGEKDLLVPPRFGQRLCEALPAGSTIWNVDGAGHCHHDDEAERVVQKEYDERWGRFFQTNLPAR